MSRLFSGVSEYLAPIPSKELMLSLIDITPEQSFKIGDDISVTISAVSGNQVKSFIDAPKDMSIIRDEAK